MSKRVELTPQIAAQIRASIGDADADVSKFVVFESRSLTTEPIGHKGGFYQGARMTASVLSEMVAKINAPGGSIPLQIMHDTGVLPVGRVFRGQMQNMPNGETELRTLFYLPADKTQLIADIENSIIDEVSVGLLTKRAMCSDCEFDYFGADATWDNFRQLTCDNGHTIGVDGVHVRLSGLDDWAELSLVNRGAAKGAKIFSRAKQTMSKETTERLAASAAPVEQRLFVGNYKLAESSGSETNPNGDLLMEKELLAQLSAKSGEAATATLQLGQANEKITGLTAKVTELEASIAAKDTKIAELEKGAPQVAELQAKLTTSEAKVTEVETQLSAAAEALLPHAKAALVASGVTEADLPKDVPALLSLITEKGLKLHQVFGSDPKTVTVTDGNLEAAKTAEEDRLEAFKTLPRK